MASCATKSPDSKSIKLRQDRTIASSASWMTSFTRSAACQKTPNTSRCTQWRWAFMMRKSSRNLNSKSAPIWQLKKVSTSRLWVEYSKSRTESFSSMITRNQARLWMTSYRKAMRRSSCKMMSANTHCIVSPKQCKNCTRKISSLAI